MLAQRDFSFCSLWDPTLRPGSGPDESRLYQMAYLARKGDRGAVAEFVDTMDWTLRKEAFECFQRVHGTRPIRYAHWFYAKLEQFLSILLYEELLVYGLRGDGSAGKPQTDRPWEEGTGVLTAKPPLLQSYDLEQAFSPDDSTEYDWSALVKLVLEAGEKRFAVFQKFVQSRLVEQRRREDIDQEVMELEPAEESVRPKRFRRSRNMERDSIIASCLEREMDRFEICSVLDRKGIETTKQMREHDLDRWTDAWQDVEFRNNVQQVFSKVRSRSKRVKP